MAKEIVNAIPERFQAPFVKTAAVLMDLNDVMEVPNEIVNYLHIINDKLKKLGVSLRSSQIIAAIILKYEMGELNEDSTLS